MNTSGMLTYKSVERASTDKTAVRDAGMRGREGSPLGFAIGPALGLIVWAALAAMVWLIFLR